MKLGRAPAPFIAPVNGSVEERLAVIASAISRKADQTNTPVFRSIGLIAPGGQTFFITVSDAGQLVIDPAT